MSPDYSSFNCVVFSQFKVMPRVFLGKLFGSTGERGSVSDSSTVLSVGIFYC